MQSLTSVEVLFYDSVKAKNVVEIVAFVDDQRYTSFSVPHVGLDPLVRSPGADQLELPLRVPGQSGTRHDQGSENRQNTLPYWSYGTQKSAPRYIRYTPY